MDAISVAITVSEVGDAWTRKTAGLHPYKDGDPIMFNGLSLHGSREEMLKFVDSIWIRLNERAEVIGRKPVYCKGQFIRWESITIPESKGTSRLATQEEIEALAIAADDQAWRSA